ncbi:MAG TPA: hypothetical protein PL182_07145 [Pseudobdellovibrionaceae bacterium]|nr:hypothetical protein [Pseudobdellovibrionaceae bacterium]
MTSSLQILSMKNIATEIDLLEGVGPLDVLEYGETMLVIGFSAPITQDVLFSLQCRLSLAGKTVAFPATGKVILCSKTDEGLFRVQLQLRQYDKETWEKFIRLSRDKQEHADRLFSAIKGKRS